MTDRQTTASDVNATIDQIEQALAESADVGQLTMNGIEQLLGGMYQKAEAAGDQQAMQVINDTWGSITHLAQHSQHNREAALTMTEIAATMRNQRNEAIKDLETLTEAIEEIDTDNPLVRGLYDSAHEAGSEDGYQNGYQMGSEDGMEASDEYAWDTAYELLRDKYVEAFGYDTEARSHQSIFTGILDCDIKVSPARKTEFFAWLDAVKADEDGDDDE